MCMWHRGKNHALMLLLLFSHEQQHICSKKKNTASVKPKPAVVPESLATASSASLWPLLFPRLLSEYLAVPDFGWFRLTIFVLYEGTKVRCDCRNLLESELFLGPAVLGLILSEHPDNSRELLLSPLNTREQLPLPSAVMAAGYVCWVHFRITVFQWPHQDVPPL